MSKYGNVNVKEIRDGVLIKPDGTYYATSSAPNAAMNMLRSQGFECKPTACGEYGWAIKITYSPEVLLNDGRPPKAGKQIETTQAADSEQEGAPQEQEDQLEQEAESAVDPFDDEIQRKKDKLNRLRSMSAADKQRSLSELEEQIAAEEQRLRQESRQPQRPNRLTLGTRDRLVAPSRPGYRRRFVNIDDLNNLRYAQARGYTICQDVQLEIECEADNVQYPSSGGSMPTRHVGTTRSGQSQKAVLMEIPEDKYLAMKAEEQVGIDQKERRMRQPGIPKEEGGYGGLTVDQRYG